MTRLQVLELILLQTTNQKLPTQIKIKKTWLPTRQLPKVPGINKTKITNRVKTTRVIHKKNKRRVKTKTKINKTSKQI